MTPIILLIVTLGLVLTAFALTLRGRERRAKLLELLELPYSEEELEQHENLAADTGLLEPGIGVVGRLLDRMEVGDRLAVALERARIALRPGEFVLGVLAGTLAFSAWIAALSGQLLLGLLVTPIVPVAARIVVARRISQRRRAIEQDLPNAMSAMASSLEAGHTLARALDLLAQESNGPLAEEIQRALAQTRIGVALPDALETMAERVAISDLEWAVNAIAIQSRTGGRLSELLHTLAEYMLAREEIRRETQVLTAEGRMSAWILAALPFGVALVVQAVSPDYARTLFSFPGYLLLVYAGVSVAIGATVVLRLVKSIEL